MRKIALPVAMRKPAGIRPQDSLIAETTPEGILLRPAVTLPVEIYTPSRVEEFDAAEEELAAVLSARRIKDNLMRVFLDANVLFSPPRAALR